jgi:hypothetical protein
MEVKVNVIRIRTPFKVFSLRRRTQHFFRILPFTLILAITNNSHGEPTPSDKYCATLQLLHANVLNEKAKTSNPLRNFVDFVTSYIKFTDHDLERYETEAIQNKMTFDAFQKWALETHKKSISDHYKPNYIKRYMDTVCGEITTQATFSNNPNPDITVTAGKQFNPNGHAYFTSETPEKTAPEAESGTGQQSR